MQDVLHKWMSQEKYLKYQNFLTHFRLPLFLECFGKISRKPIIYQINIYSISQD